MRKIDLGQTVGILANVSVIARIVFLSIETNQTGQVTDPSNRIAITEASTELLYGNVDWLNAILANPQLVESWVKLASQQSLSAPEEVQARLIALSLIRLWQSSESYFDNDPIDDESFAGMLAAPAVTIEGSPGLSLLIVLVHRRGNMGSPDSRMSANIESALQANGL